MSQVEKKLQADNDYKLRYCPAFLVGPPRCGSTVTMQLLTQNIPTCYFTNLTTSSCHALGYPLPITTAKLAKWFSTFDTHHLYESNEGNIQGRVKSTEGTDIWAYWFGNKREPVDPVELTKLQVQNIYQAVAATERAFDMPFVNKTINNSLRIRALAKIFPTAIFIQIFRNPADIAQSIYKIRKAKSAHVYFGAKPKECNDYESKSLLQQVCEQIYYIEKNIAFEKSIVGEERFISVSYEAICNDPICVLQEIVRFMSLHGSPASVLPSVPNRLRFSGGPKVSPEKYNLIRSYLADLYGMESQRLLP